MRWIRAAIALTLLSILPSTTARATPADIPGPPRNISVIKNTGTNLVTSWTEPEQNPDAVVDYEIRYSSDAGASWTTFIDGLSTKTEISLTGLTQGLNYILSLRSTGVAGNSRWIIIGARYEEISSGYMHTCARLATGQITCWGSNAFGQLGDGTTIQRLAPTVVIGITNAKEVAVGTVHSCALLDTGQIKCWGSNEYRELGDGTTTNRSTPSDVPGIANATAVSSGARHSCALLDTGQIRCWGSNENGQLGDGTTTNRSTPSDVRDITNATAVTAGSSYSCALLVTGQIRCWGINWAGQLGNGHNGNSSIPSWVSGISNAIEVTAGNRHTCALLDTGQIKCWGNNGEHELADGTTTNRSTPSDVSGIANATAVSTSSQSSHTCALLDTGQIKCWGTNGNSQLGDGTSSERSTPVLVSSIANATAVTAGSSYSCALLVTGQIRCWGTNNFGQLGDGTKETASYPVGVWRISGTTAVTSGGTHSCALLDTGEIKCWGSNEYGQLGDDTTENHFAPTRVWGIRNASAVTNGFDHSCALLDTGQIKCWGGNWAGQLGNGKIWQWSTDRPVLVSDITNATAITAGRAHSCALLATGQIKCWGNNWASQLGNGYETTQSAPVLVSGITGAISVDASGEHTCALLDTGQIKCWGNNAAGQLGDGTVSERSTPVLVSSIANAAAVNSGYSHSCALLDTGQIKCWGGNWSGQLGVTSSSNQYTPVLKSDVTNAIAVTAGGDNSCALLVTGQIKCWGNNAAGQLGNGMPTDQGTSIASLVSNITNATAVETGFDHSCALLDTGQIKCWGSNATWQLGDSTIAARYTPVWVYGYDNFIPTYYIPTAPKTAILSSNSPSATTLFVSWAVLDDDGLTVDKHKLEWSTNGTYWNSEETIQESTTITGLSPGTTYQVRVSAQSEAGWGAPSEVIQRTTIRPPDAVRFRLRTDISPGSLYIYATAPNSFGLQIDTYRLEWSSNGTTWDTLETWVPEDILVLSDAPSPRRYEVRITAHSVAGWGKTSVNFATTKGLISYKSGAGISGIATVGKTLTALPGSWQNLPKANYSYQWYSCTKASKTSSTVGKITAGCKTVAGATKSSLKLKTADKKSYIAVLITGKNTAGTKKVFTATVGSVK